MRLNKAQFDHISRLYEKRRRLAREEARERQEAFYQAHPQIESLSREIILLAGEQLKASLEGDETRLEQVRSRRQELIRQKKQEMAALGVKEEDWEPRYACPLCQDTGWIDNQECSCWQKTVIQEFYSDSILWRRTAEESFENFSLEWYDDEKKLSAFQGMTCREVIAENLKEARDYVAGFGQRRDGILMTGPVGTGKTFLCNCMAGALLKAGYSVLYLSAQELFDQMAAVTFDREEQDQLFTEQFGAADLLIIDDLGTEFTSHKLAANALFTILNERIIKNRGTVISTNLDLEELRNRYSAPVLSRMIGEFRIMRFAGQDIRLAIRLK